VGAALGDAPLLEYHDLIGMTHRGDAMRDHDRRARAHQVLELPQDGLFGVGVHAGETVVEQEGFLFTHNREKQIEPSLRKEVAKLGYTVSVQSDKEEEKIKKDVIDMLIEKYTKTWYDDVFHVVQTIPKQLRYLYKVEGSGR